MSIDARKNLVGPVLQAGSIADAILAAIRSLNPSVTVFDRGAYLRIQVPDRCVVTREAIELALGAPFHLPGDLEAVMPSFAGRFAVTEDDAVWAASRPGPAGSARTGGG